MATEFVHVAPSDPRGQNIERIVAGNNGRFAPSREEAAAVLAERGILPPGKDSGQPTIKPRTAAADEYHVDLTGVSLPEGASAADVAAGAAEFGFALGLPPYLANAIGKDMAGSADPDPAVVAKQLDGIGIDAKEALRVVDEMLTAGSRKLGRKLDIAAKDLSAFALSQLYAYAQVEQRRASR